MAHKYDSPYPATDGRQIVRLRKVNKPVGEGFGIAMFRLTHPFGRRSLAGRDFISEQGARTEAKERGWSFLN